jgi:Zinc carboxypeptidase
MNSNRHGIRIVVLFTAVSAVLLCGVYSPAAAADRMTYAQAQARIPQRELPDFWIGDVQGLAGRFEKLTRGAVSVIAISPGGRPMHLITYGQKEPVEHKANFNSAIGAREPQAYMDKASREKPVILFVGPVHGHEVEALTGLVNFITVMETGKDLSGIPQMRLQQLGSQCRLLIVPEGNPDGIARFKLRALQGMDLQDVQFWGQGTWSDDTLCGWPGVKRQHPLAGDNVGFLGCYFNDAGINPMHDEFFAPMGPEAPALLKVARLEGPDLAVSFHSHSSTPAVLRPAYVTTEVQEDIRTLAEEYYALLAQRRLPHANPFTVHGEGGSRPSPFNLTSALYHVSGARPFTFECPHGIQDNCQVTLEQILDIQLTLYEAMLQHELDKKQ